jgi:hypothetical protein
VLPWPEEESLQELLWPSPSHLVLEVRQREEEVVLQHRWEALEVLQLCLVSGAVV